VIHDPLQAMRLTDNPGVGDTGKKNAHDELETLGLDFTKTVMGPSEQWTHPNDVFVCHSVGD